jgi:hypothetical protein
MHLGCWSASDWQAACGSAALECGGFDTALLLTNVEGWKRQMKTKMKMLE